MNNRARRRVLVPNYPIIDQTGLDAQATLDASLWKLEWITRDGLGDRWKLSLEARFTSGLGSHISLSSLRNDDYVPAELAWYF